MGIGTALSEMIEILVSGLEEYAGGIAVGINDYVTNLLFVTQEGTITGLSAFGGTVAMFSAVALGVGLTSLVFSWIRSLGN